MSTKSSEYSWRTDTADLEQHNSVRIIKPIKKFNMRDIVSIEDIGSTFMSIKLIDGDTEPIILPGTEYA